MVSKYKIKTALANEGFLPSICKKKIIFLIAHKKTNEGGRHEILLTNIK